MASRYRVDPSGVSYFDDYFYRSPQPMPEADPATFASVGEWFGRDRRHVYFVHRVVAEADPASFVVLGGYNDFWAKDRSLAFYFWPTRSATQYKVLRSRSLEDFELIAWSPFAEYARDRELVYYRGKRVRGADLQTFSVLSSDLGGVPPTPSYHFAADASRVYFNGVPIKGAERESFRVAHAPGLGDDEYGVDRSRAYRRSPATGRVEVLTHDQLPANVRMDLFGDRT